jgi:23S rRNA pseudouridine1911/1915/1917 synthase
VTAREHPALLVPDEAAGTRLDRFLAEPLGSRSRAQSLIDAGRVRVDDTVRAKKYLVGGGELVEIDDPEVAPESEPVDVPFGVAYEDEHLMVVDKPAGVVVHPARGHRTGTLAQALAGRAAGGDEPWRAGIVHRLDRNTS